MSIIHLSHWHRPIRHLILCHLQELDLPTNATLLPSPNVETDTISFTPLIIASRLFNCFQRNLRHLIRLVRLHLFHQRIVAAARVSPELRGVKGVAKECCFHPSSMLCKHGLVCPYCAGKVYYHIQYLTIAYYIHCHISISIVLHPSSNKQK